MRIFDFFGVALLTGKGRFLDVFKHRNKFDLTLDFLRYLNCLFLKILVGALDSH